MISSNSNKGFTLIEVAMVVVLLIVMVGVATTKFNILDSLNYKKSLRRFTNTWELLASNSKAKGEAYRLIINLENNSYSVKREIPANLSSKKNEDVLKDFRIESKEDKKNRTTKQRELNLNQEVEEDEKREGDLLENLFFQKVFFDPNADVNLGTPLDNPSLAEEQFLSSGIRFRDVKISGEKADGPEAIIRFSANGASDFAVVHLSLENAIFTAVVNPATGKVRLYDQDIDFDWAIGKTK